MKLSHLFRAAQLAKWWSGVWIPCQYRACHTWGPVRGERPSSQSLLKEWPSAATFCTLWFLRFHPNHLSYCHQGQSLTQGQPVQAQASGFWYGLWWIVLLEKRGIISFLTLSPLLGIMSKSGSCWELNWENVRWASRAFPNVLESTANWVRQKSIARSPMPERQAGSNQEEKNNQNTK